jgi:membrane-associated phospholipid phosphatase
MNTVIISQPNGYPLEEVQSWDLRLAYWISQVACPPVLGLAATLVAAQSLATSTAWLWAVSYLLLVIGLPCLYIAWLIQRGELRDFHLPVRQERIRPLACALLMALVAWGLLSAVAAPRLLQWLAGVNSVQTALFLAITLRWKISLHCVTAANLVVLTLMLLGSIAAPLVMTIPLIAWSRVRLQRHTIAQTAGGALMGGLLFMLTLLIWHW